MHCDISTLIFHYHLCSVGQEDGWGQVASDATEDVNDWDAQPTRQLLQVPQDGHLESHWHQAVKDPGRTDGQSAHVFVMWRMCVCRWKAARVGKIIPLCVEKPTPQQPNMTLPINKIGLYPIEV